MSLQTKIVPPSTATGGWSRRKSDTCMVIATSSDTRLPYLTIWSWKKKTIRSYSRFWNKSQVYLLSPERFIKLRYGRYSLSDSCLCKIFYHRRSTVCVWTNSAEIRDPVLDPVVRPSRTKYIPRAYAVIEYSPLIHTMFYWRTAVHRFYVFVEHSDLGCVDLSSCFLNF